MKNNSDRYDTGMMPQETGSDRKKNPLLLLLIPVVILALVLIGVGGVMLAGGSQESGYAKILEQAELAQENGDIEAAIDYYLEAIDMEPENADLYLNAADLYEEQGEIEKAVQLLQRGADNTNSARIRNALEYLQRGETGEESQVELLPDSSEDKDGVETQTVILNDGFLTFIAGASNRDYNSEFGENTKQLSGGITEVTYTAVPVSCYYSQSPSDSSHPSYVVVRDLCYLFPGMGDTITLNEIQELPYVMDTEITGSAGANKIQFLANGCSVVIECDETGTASRNAANQIYVVTEVSGDSEDAEQEICTLTGSVIDATTGKGVDATLRFHENGAANGDVVLEVEAGSSGSYEAQLAPGEYVVEILKEGYITEYFEQNMYSWVISDTADFVISPELDEGQIRIVLEWGATPTDLDSHLIGTSSGGQSVHMYFGDRKYTDICELDVDDMDGYGPETTTIYDIHGSYDFVVDDYTNSGMLGMSGATVKIYMPGESAPTIVSVPADISDNWYVCSIRDGALTIENRAY